MPSKWQKDLDQARQFRSLIILCGNIRDLCPFSRSDADPLELLELDDYLARWALRDFTSLQVYDPVDRFRSVFPEEPQAAERRATPSAIEGATPGQCMAGGLAAEARRSMGWVAGAGRRA